MHPKFLALLKQYSKVLLMDCTYKINHFHIPLLDIFGSSSLNCTFFAVFIFLSSKKEKNYLNALKMLQEVMIIQEITFPKVVVTNKEQVLMNALSFVFPQSYNLLCNWHINKNCYGHEETRATRRAMPKLAARKPLI